MRGLQKRGRAWGSTWILAVVPLTSPSSSLKTVACFCRSLCKTLGTVMWCNWLQSSLIANSQSHPNKLGPLPAMTSNSNWDFCSPYSTNRENLGLLGTHRYRCSGPSLFAVVVNGWIATSCDMWLHWWGTRKPLCPSWGWHRWPLLLCIWMPQLQQKHDQGIGTVLNLSWGRHFVNVMSSTWLGCHTGTRTLLMLSTLVLALQPLQCVPSSCNGDTPQF